MKNQHFADREYRRGTAAVEFAISLPLLILLMVGCIDVGRFAYHYISITNAASEAAAFAGLNPPGKLGGEALWIAAVQQRAISESAMLDPPLTEADVTVDLSVLPQGLVGVEVSHTFESLVDWPGLPHLMPMNRRIVMSQTP